MGVVVGRGRGSGGAGIGLEVGARLVRWVRRCQEDYFVAFSSSLLFFCRFLPLEPLAWLLDNSWEEDGSGQIPLFFSSSSATIF